MIRNTNVMDKIIVLILAHKNILQLDDERFDFIGILTQKVE